jgi:hypothetical protein
MKQKKINTSRLHKTTAEKHTKHIFRDRIVPAKKKPPRKDTTTTVKQIKQTLDSHNSTNETSKANRKSTEYKTTFIF